MKKSLLKIVGITAVVGSCLLSSASASDKKPGGIVGNPISNRITLLKPLTLAAYYEKPALEIPILNYQSPTRPAKKGGFLSDITEKVDELKSVLDFTQYLKFPLGEFRNNTYYIRFKDITFEPRKNKYFIGAQIYWAPKR